MIGKNSLIEIPDEIGNLKNLVELNAAFCGPMVRIPETIQYCDKLENLYIDQTMYLPHSINMVNNRLRIIRLGK